MNSTKKFIRSRRISAILPWIGIIGVLFLVFSLIMYGLLLFLVEIGFIANFYYIIDEYNWVIERAMFDHKKLINRTQSHVIHLVLMLSVIIGIVTTIILIQLQRQNFVSFCVGICFISVIYFSSRLIENFQVILHIAFDSWKKFYILVTVATIILGCVCAFLLYLNMVAYFAYCVAIGIMYVITYYALIEIHDKAENDLGGHKHFIDLPDRRFDKKY